VHKVTKKHVKHKEKRDFFSKYHKHGMQMKYLWDCGSQKKAVTLHRQTTIKRKKKYLLIINKVRI
jgi:hypothetical protein